MKEDTTNCKLFIGIDIRKRSWKIKTSTDLFDGKSFNSPPHPGALKKWVDKYYGNYTVVCAYDTGCCGYHPHRSFLENGWKSLVVNPADIARTNKSQYQKTDKIDAAMKCSELKDGRLHSITVPESKREALRCLFRSRVELVKDFLRIKSTIII